MGTDARTFGSDRRRIGAHPTQVVGSTADPMTTGARLADARQANPDRAPRAQGRRAELAGYSPAQIGHYRGSHPMRGSDMGPGRMPPVAPPGPPMPMPPVAPPAPPGPMPVPPIGWQPMPSPVPPAVPPQFSIYRPPVSGASVSGALGGKAQPRPSFGLGAFGRNF